MSETELDFWRREIRQLRETIERMHRENGVAREKDCNTFNAALKETQGAFSKAMDSQRDQFQTAINQTFAQYENIRHQGERNGFLLEQVVGDGEPGGGRLGVIETSVEKLKQFRWQLIAGGMVAFYVAQQIFGGKHG